MNRPYEVIVLDDVDDYGFRMNLQIIRNGKVIRSEYDGGEPEDQLLSRDWKWVEEALREAYDFGLEDGRAGK